MRIEAINAKNLGVILRIPKSEQVIAISTQTSKVESYAHVLLSHYSKEARHLIPQMDPREQQRILERFWQKRIQILATVPQLLPLIFRVPY